LTHGFRQASIDIWGQRPKIKVKA
jgi:hypothetical protein